MTWTLFLDDIRFPEDVRYDYNFGTYRGVIICRSMDDAVWCVKQYGLPTFISFDHDLADVHYETGDGEKTGYTFAKWFCDYIMDNSLDIPEGFSYHVHSMNPVGAENIRAYMKNFLEYYDNEDT
jgi:hypothetical protein